MQPAWKKKGKSPTSQGTQHRKGGSSQPEETELFNRAGDKFEKLFLTVSITGVMLNGITGSCLTIVTMVWLLKQLLPIGHLRLEVKLGHDLKGSPFLFSVLVFYLRFINVTLVCVFLMNLL